VAKAGTIDQPNGKRWLIILVVQARALVVVVKNHVVAPSGMLHGGEDDPVEATIGSVKLTGIDYLCDSRVVILQLVAGFDWVRLVQLMGSANRRARSKMKAFAMILSDIRRDAA
jgi:hypothetical protein